MEKEKEEQILNNVWLNKNNRYMFVLQQRLKGRTLKDIGKVLGLTPERIRQMESKGNEHLRLAK